jgi:hypothetical protein
MTYASILAALLVACSDSPSAELELGRPEVKNVSLAKDSAAVRQVRLENKGDAVAHLKKVTLEGDPLGVELRKEKALFAVKLGEPLDYEIAAQSRVTVELKIDAKQEKLGVHQAKLTFESDAGGGKALVLPVEWEVVEPTKEDDEDAPVAKPKGNWQKYENQKGPPPKITCGEYRHDFGKISSGEQLHTSFTLRNEGEGDLVIVKVGVQCHCTLPKLKLPDRELSGRQLNAEQEYGTLKPGEEATLDCNVDTAGIGGVMHKRIDVYTNDLARSPLSITLTAVVENPFRFTPASVNLVTGRGTPVERTVRMASIDQGKFAITGHSMKEPAPWSVEYHEVAPRGDEQCAWEVTLTSRTDLPSAEYGGKLTLELDHPRLARSDQLHYSVRYLPDVTWTVENDRRASPEQFAFGIVRTGLHDVRTIHFENHHPTVAWKPTKATVTSQQADAPYTAEVVEVEPGKRYDVKVSIVREPTVHSFRGVLHVESDSPAMPSLAIKFDGLWAPTPKTAPAAPPADGAPKDAAPKPSGESPAKKDDGR